MSSCLAECRTEKRCGVGRAGWNQGLGGWARGASNSAAESRRARGWSGGVGLEWTQERGLAVAVDEVLSTGRMIYGWSWRGAGILVRRKC